MQNMIDAAEVLYDSYRNKRYTNIAMLNDLDIVHGFGFADGIYKDNNSDQLDQFTPTDSFTKFLIYSKMMEG